MEKSLIANQKNAQFGVFQVSFWSAFWIQCRPYLFFVSGITGLVGLAPAQEAESIKFFAAFFAFFFTYGLGQALTDVFQIDTDSISSSYRPLCKGEISRSQVMVVSLTGLGICGTVFFLCNPLTLPFSILGVIGLATYTHFKRRWWGGPFWNSWVVALLPIMGNLCVGFELEKMLSSPQSLAIIGSVFFSYAIFVLLGYFKDVSADRATKYQTLPVVAGWKNSILVSGLFLVSTIGCDVLLWNSTDNSLKTFSFSLFTSLGLWLFGIFCLFFAHFLMWKSAKEEEAHFSIAYVVRGYVLIHSGESLFLAPSLLWFCFFFYAGFEVFLKARPVPSQI